MPSEQYDIFAPWDGNVIEVRVENGQLVKKDEIVLVLRSDDLDTELLAAKNMASEAKNKLINLVLERSRAVDTGRLEEVTRIDTRSPRPKPSGTAPSKRPPCLKSGSKPCRSAHRSTAWSRHSR